MGHHDREEAPRRERQGPRGTDKKLTAWAKWHLDPRKRTCDRCQKDAEDFGLPKPDCNDPDGTGAPCHYPSIVESFDPENARAWGIWAMYPEAIIGVVPSMAGCTFTLNSASLIAVLEMIGTEPSERDSLYRKIRAIFNVWREVEDSVSMTKTQAAMDRTAALRRELG